MNQSRLTLKREDRLDSQAEEALRTPFQRDRDRILYSTAFQRLVGVTQVVSAQESTVLHNRLTHCLEVAQIARRMAERFIAKNATIAKFISPDVVEAAALAHDLGHPPFGHVAEMALDRLVFDEGKGLPDGFEGNA